MTEVFTLLIIFQVKHFLADYPLQTPYMLGKFKGGTEWIKPLASHAWVHAFLTFMIAAGYGFFHVPVVVIVGVALLDFVVHFAVDRVKASPHMLGRYKPDNKFFWWALGGDQAAHHLTHYAIIAALVSQ